MVKVKTRMIFDSYELTLFLFAPWDLPRIILISIDAFLR